MQDEPVLILAIVDAAATLAVAFGVPISAEEKAAILGLGQAILAVIFGFIARQSVTPNSRVATRRE